MSENSAQEKEHKSSQLNFWRGLSIILIIVLICFSVFHFRTVKNNVNQNATSVTMQETEANTETTSIIESADEVNDETALSLWTENAPLKKQLVEYMKAITDESSPDFIPVKNRIAVFDFDGTLFCETDPVYFDYRLFYNRVMDDPDYKDRASDVEKETARKVKEMMDTGVSAKGLEIDHGKGVASSFKGMTPEEFYQYVKEFKDRPAPSYDGMKNGEAFYKPMLQVVEYLQANDFKVYVISGTDRMILRPAAEGVLNIPNSQIIGSDESFVATNQGDTDGLQYQFTKDDKVVLGGNFIIKNLKMNKVAVIEKEIGDQPVLSFGNSSGDTSMANFVITNNKYKSAAYMLCCDDTERENGNVEKAEAMYKSCEENGWTPISMKNDWTTIYGENVTYKGGKVSSENNESFYMTEITDEIFNRIYGKSFKEDCTLPREDLRYLHVLHKDLDGNDHEGEMIVNKHIAEDVLDILQKLYDANYPIEKIRLVDEYNADDELSMEDNNSSSFNFRFISHTTKISKHGLGLAVDINTLYNPYVKEVDGERVIEPITAEPYLDRTAEFPYKIDENDLCYKLFTEKGFEWGGSWTTRKDYQHFEMPDEKIAEWYPDNQ